MSYLGWAPARLCCRIRLRATKQGWVSGSSWSPARSFERISECHASDYSFHLLRFRCLVYLPQMLLFERLTNHLTWLQPLIELHHESNVMSHCIYLFSVE